MTQITWANCQVTLGELQPWADNPRLSTKTQARRLLESWQRFGQVQTIAIGPAGQVYDGHQRLSALLTLHGKSYQVDARRSDRELTDEERRALVVTLHAGAVGSWNWDSLANWDAGELQEWGFDSDTLANWQRDVGALGNLLASEEVDSADAEPQIDRAAELQEKWQVRPGDLWRIGEHRLACGDCTDREVVERVMGGEKADMIIADPPYGVNIVAANGYVGGGESANGMVPFGGVKNRKGFVGGGEGDSLRHGHYAIEEHGKAKRLGGSDEAAKPFGSKNVRGSYGATNMVDVGKYAPIVGDDTTETAIRSSRFYLELYPGAAQFWWGGNYYADTLAASSCWVVWDKETTGNFADCELAWSNLDRSAKLFRHRWNGMLRDSERERRLHPTQKPAALASFLMAEFGKDNDVVLDPFAGAGWVIVACQNLGRRGRGIEISPEYCAVVLERMATAFPGIEIERIADDGRQ